MKYFLVLTLCSIGAFVIVIRMRPDVLSFAGFSTNPTATASPAPPTTPPPEKEKKKVVPAARTARAERPVEPAVAFPTYRYEEQLPGTRQIVVNEAGRRLARATVTADTLPIYATNSANSRIVKVLNKGDQIQTDLAVIDSQGHWSLVTVPGQRISGYVHTEDIDFRRIRTDD